MDSYEASVLTEWIETLTSLAEAIENEDGYTEAEARARGITGLGRALAALREEADGAADRAWNEAHPLVRCGATDGCEEVFTYCPEGDHYCPSCGDNGENAVPFEGDDEDDGALVAIERCDTCKSTEARQSGTTLVCAGCGAVMTFEEG